MSVLAYLFGNIVGFHLLFVHLWFPFVFLFQLFFKMFFCFVVYPCWFCGCCFVVGFLSSLNCFVVRMICFINVKIVILYDLSVHRY